MVRHIVTDCEMAHVILKTFLIGLYDVSQMAHSEQFHSIYCCWHTSDKEKKPWRILLLAVSLKVDIKKTSLFSKNLKYLNK